VTDEGLPRRLATASARICTGKRSPRSAAPSAEPSAAVRSTSTSRAVPPPSPPTTTWHRRQGTVPRGIFHKGPPSTPLETSRRVLTGKRERAGARKPVAPTRRSSAASSCLQQLADQYRTMSHVAAPSSPRRPSLEGKLHAFGGRETSRSTSSKRRRTSSPVRATSTYTAETFTGSAPSTRRARQDRDRQRLDKFLRRGKLTIPEKPAAS